MKKLGEVQVAFPLWSRYDRLAVPKGISFPFDPLTEGGPSFDEESRRRTVAGVLDSYHSNYDVPCEAIQNAVDAIEDAKLLGLGGPYLISIVVNLSENWMSFLDTGVGMTPGEVARAFAPHVSYKSKSPAKLQRDRRNLYRGFKGIGLTFLAYGTDDITIHSKRDGSLTKARMQYGRAWVTEERTESAFLTEDTEASPLEQYSRGTYVKVKFSQNTRPRSLSHLGSSLDIWKTVLRTKTAIGQVIAADDKPIVSVKANLSLAVGNQTTSEVVDPTFMYPHEISRNPAFRFLNLVSYYRQHAEQTTPPPDKRRQDGVYLNWDAERIKKELTSSQRTEFSYQMEKYDPFTYAFVPYQGSVWSELNQISTGHKKRNYLYSGLMIAINRQRLADIFEIDPSRYETFARNVFVAVHFHGAKPDHGRKTIDVESTNLAKTIGDRIVQYLAKQRELLRPPGEAPTPEQRQVERDHEEWIFNVKLHRRTSPLHIPPVAYLSEPLTEHDVVGLFHQLCAVGVFAGAQIYATSQSKTYDCLMEYDCLSSTRGLKYSDTEHTPLGISPYTVGTEERFRTRQLTLEFKNNLDGLIDDIEGDSPKQFENIDICVCWSTISSSFKGYELQEIVEANIDQRMFPGVTHLLSHDGSSTPISIIMLKTVTDMIQTGRICIPVEE